LLNNIVRYAKRAGAQAGSDKLFSAACAFTGWQPRTLTASAGEGDSFVTEDDDILVLTLRALMVSKQAGLRQIMRAGAAAAATPLECVDVETVGFARAQIARGDIDLVFLDADLPAADRSKVILAARETKNVPFSVLLADDIERFNNPAAEGCNVDGVVAKPASPDQARSMLERCARVRMPNRVLIVDDSATMRSIVSKILQASHFRLDIEHAEEGAAALRQMQSGQFDLVFLDYNMPGLDGLGTLTELKKKFPQVQVVMISSAQDTAMAEKVREAGASAFLRKPFFPHDIDAVLKGLCGLKSVGPGVRAPIRRAS
jgi:CheY-like chemotaxis protein